MKDIKSLNLQETTFHETICKRPLCDFFPDKYETIVVNYNENILSIEAIVSTFLGSHCESITDNTL